MKSDTDGLLVKELTYWLATTWLTLSERESECVFAARAMLCDRCMTLVIGVRLLVFLVFSNVKLEARLVELCILLLRYYGNDRCYLIGLDSTSIPSSVRIAETSNNT